MWGVHWEIRVVKRKRSPPALRIICLHDDVVDVVVVVCSHLGILYCCWLAVHSNNALGACFNLPIIHANQSSDRFLSSNKRINEISPSSQQTSSVITHIATNLSFMGRTRTATFTAPNSDDDMAQQLSGDDAQSNGNEHLFCRPGFRIIGVGFDWSFRAK